MALSAQIIWEIRTTGNNDNGGGFKAGASGTDYSQQDSAQLTLTDLAMTAGGTTLTSATGGFTAEMIGNVIRIKSGTNFTAGWYEITARADTNTVTIDRDATNGSDATSGTGSVGGARALPTDAFFEALTAGNTVYIKAGTYTLTENLQIANDGTEANQLIIIGYNSIRDDNPSGINRPLFVAGTYSFWLDDSWTIKNIRLNTTEQYGLALDQCCNVFNCQSRNISSSANRYAFWHTGNSNVWGRIIDSEFCSLNGYALFFNGTVVCFIVMGSYIHNSLYGIYTLPGGVSFFLLDNIIVSCTTGFGLGSITGLICKNNTFNGCTTGIVGASVTGSNFINNIIANCTTGASWTSEKKGNYWDYNNWYGNDTDVSNVTKGANATANDPEFEFVGVQGTDDSGTNNKATSMVDTSENFTTLGVSVGDTILNKTDGSWGTITSISTTTNPNDTVNFSGGLTGGTDNDFDNGDTYSILGNFSLQDGSECIGAGFGIRLGVGA